MKSPNHRLADFGELLDSHHLSVDPMQMNQIGIGSIDFSNQPGGKKIQRSSGLAEKSEDHFLDQNVFQAIEPPSKFSLDQGGAGSATGIPGAPNLGIHPEVKQTGMEAKHRIGRSSFSRTIDVDDFHFGGFRLAKGFTSNGATKRSSQKIDRIRLKRIPLLTHR